MCTHGLRMYLLLSCSSKIRIPLHSMKSLLERVGSTSTHVPNPCSRREPKQTPSHRFQDALCLYTLETSTPYTLHLLYPSSQGPGIKHLCRCEMSTPFQSPESQLYPTHCAPHPQVGGLFTTDNQPRAPSWARLVDPSYSRKSWARGRVPPDIKWAHDWRLSGKNATWRKGSQVWV